MTPNDVSVTYRDLGVEGLAETQSMWERLRDFHVVLSARFAEDIRLKAFAARCAELQGKSAAGGLRVDVAYLEPSGRSVGYCITSRSGAAGEIESLYVDDELRGHGIGTALMRRALAWFDDHGVTKRLVSLMVENDRALRFYQQFRFHAREIVMQQVPVHPPCAATASPTVG